MNYRNMIIIELCMRAWRKKNSTGPEMFRNDLGEVKPKVRLKGYRIPSGRPLWSPEVGRSMVSIQDMKTAYPQHSAGGRGRKTPCRVQRSLKSPM